MGLIALSPNPFLIGEQFKKIVLIDSEEYEVIYNYNDLLQLINLFKIYLIFRGFLINSKFKSNRAFRVCQLYGSSNNRMFVMRCLMKEYPLETVFLLFIIGILVFGYALKICEGPLSQVLPNMNHNKI